MTVFRLHLLYTLSRKYLIVVCAVLSCACLIPWIFFDSYKPANDYFDQSRFTNEIAYIDPDSPSLKQAEFLDAYQKLTEAVTAHSYFSTYAKLLRLEISCFGTPDRGRAIELEMAARFCDKLSDLSHPVIYRSLKEAPTLYYLSALLQPTYCWLLYVPHLLCILSSTFIFIKQGILAKLPLSPFKKYLQAILAQSICSFICTVFVLTPTLALTAITGGIGDLSYPIISNTTEGILLGSVGEALLYQLEMYVVVCLFLSMLALLPLMVGLPRPVAYLLAVLPLTISGFEMINTFYLRFNLTVSTAISYIPAAFSCTSRLSGWANYNITSTPLLLARLHDHIFYLLILIFACICLLVVSFALFYIVPALNRRLT